MADENELNIDEILNDLALENAKATTRAVIAEARVRRYAQIIASHQQAIAKLKEHAPNELLEELGLPVPPTPLRSVEPGEPDDDLGLDKF